mmetsp:Transcript_23471/g.48118  ORF Transcript_23471/g.48118 Transcript_23471/m.48118 type:complete len:445 (-) Transcript_23471:143-1477(-)
MLPQTNESESIMPHNPRTNHQSCASKLAPGRLSRTVLCWWVATIIVGGISGAVVSIITLSVNIVGNGHVVSVRSGQDIVVGLRDGSDSIVKVAKIKDNDTISRHSSPIASSAGTVLTSEVETSTPTYAPTNPSPYEKLHLKSSIPWWAKKGTKLRNFVPPKGNEMCFVHVGKTAGSSIGCALGFRLHCNYERGSRPYLPGRLPKSVTHLFHQAVYDCPIETSYYLFVVRDPLARSRSAFVYGRPDKDGNSPHEHHVDNLNRLYNECPFQTMNDLARFGLKEDGFASEKCKSRAVGMMRGVGRFENHHFFNYQYYLESIPKDGNILVIRTEHMEQDWINLERGLGGQIMSNITFPRDNTNQKEPRDLILGDEERMLLCRELCQEIMVYKRILRKALNIDDSAYEKSIDELRDVCPTEADAVKCTFRKPDISEKINHYRGPIDRLE